jgi:hypothetical protein
LYNATSFSKRFVEFFARTTAGRDGMTPYFSGLEVLGLLQDSNSASSRGVMARNEKIRTFFLDRFRQHKSSVAIKANTRAPKTETKTIQIVLPIFKDQFEKVLRSPVIPKIGKG